jgi:Holliday junction DNA helicase RuvA
VNGVGPKVALSVLSGLSVDDLSVAVAAQDAARLTKVPGVGRKTADRIVLELRDKLAGAIGSAAPAAASPGSDVLSALLALGYNEREASAAVKQLPADLPLTDAIRQALKQLSKT